MLLTTQKFAVKGQGHVLLVWKICSCVIKKLSLKKLPLTIVYCKFDIILPTWRKLFWLKIESVLTLFLRLSGRREQPGSGGVVPDPRVGAEAAG